MDASNKPLKDYFYSRSQAEPFCLGHIRIDFGKEGDEYWAKFFEHTHTSTLMTEALRKEANQHVQGLYQSGMTQRLKGMRGYCEAHPEAVIGTLPDGWNDEYGFVTHSENLTFYTRCRPICGDYQAYIYIYTRHFEEQLNERSADDLLRRSLS